MCCATFSEEALSDWAACLVLYLAKAVLLRELRRVLQRCGGALVGCCTVVFAARVRVTRSFYVMEGGRNSLFAWQSWEELGATLDVCEAELATMTTARLSEYKNESIGPFEFSKRFVSHYGSCQKLLHGKDSFSEKEDPELLNAVAFPRYQAMKNVFATCQKALWSEENRQNLVEHEPDMGSSQIEQCFEDVRRPAVGDGGRAGRL